MAALLRRYTKGRHAVSRCLSPMIYHIVTHGLPPVICSHGQSLLSESLIGPPACATRLGDRPLRPHVLHKHVTDVLLISL